MTARATIDAILRGLADGGRLMVGIPSYETYRAHLRDRHPEVPAMSEAAFVRERQAARFGGGGRGGFRCC